MNQLDLDMLYTTREPIQIYQEHYHLLFFEINKTNMYTRNRHTLIQSTHTHTQSIRRKLTKLISKRVFSI